jgi:UDP-glucose:(heptosyl)LPS alpha-1,3-glucosyltransferase
MSNANLTIGFARRGYSASGGAEAYLKRLAGGVVELGHTTVLFTTSDWPAGDWTDGEIKHLRSRSPLGFAHELEEEALRKVPCDVLMSLERVNSCDVYRAGDGVHRAWLERRKKFETPLDQFLRRFNRKHGDIVLLEKALLDDRGAERVIANSKMVKDEIVDFYNYRPDRIDVVRNGVPLDQFRFDAEVRDKARTKLGLSADEQAILFVGSGWERKGLRFAIEAVESSAHRKMRLFVAGRGSQDRYESKRVQFLGEVLDLLPIYAAADLFLLPTIYDPFSNACLEALACGLPVITTRANGFSEIIEDKIHGSIIDRADDVPALRKALDVWCDPTWRSAARSSILKRAAQFDISKNIAQTIPILLQAATDAASRSGNMRKT